MFEIPFAWIELREADSGPIVGYAIVSGLYIGVLRTVTLEGEDLTDTFPAVMRRRVAAGVSLLHLGASVPPGSAPEMFAVFRRVASGLVPVVTEVGSVKMLRLNRVVMADAFAERLGLATHRAYTVKTTPERAVVTVVDPGDGA